MHAYQKTRRRGHHSRPGHATDDGRGAGQGGAQPTRAQLLYAKSGDPIHPGRSPDSRLVASRRLPNRLRRSVAHQAVRLPAYSGATVADSHRLPYSAPTRRGHPGSSYGTVKVRSSTSIPTQRPLGEADLPADPASEAAQALLQPFGEARDLEIGQQHAGGVGARASVNTGARVGGRTADVEPED